MHPSFDIGIMGGGLAGLSLSIQLASAGYAVVLWEKETYPFHRVCGEYLSRESVPFLGRLGIDVYRLGVSEIDELEISTPTGKTSLSPLPLGGIGISRFALDHALYQRALAAGVEVWTDTKVLELQERGDQSLVLTSKGAFVCKLAIGSFGKRSSLDIKMNRSFIRVPKSAEANYVGVKYHVRIPFPRNRIALHHFEKGYCGLSAIEDDRYALCYMVAASQLQRYGTVAAMEQALFQNHPHLRSLWQQAEFLWDRPLTIAQIAFEPKSQVEKKVLMLGDAAGMITPLCGNGMSMALHASYLAFPLIAQYVEGSISREVLESRYQQSWQEHFASRLRVGRWLQNAFQSKLAANLLLSSLQYFPSVRSMVIRQTHGKPF